MAAAPRLLGNTFAHREKACWRLALGGRRPPVRDDGAMTGPTALQWRNLPAPLQQRIGSAACRGPVGLYVHVPFCATRCGYCDFNTYTAGELGSSSSPQSWLEAVRQELDGAASLLGGRPVSTVFVGGGTPSLLGGDGLAALLDAVGTSFDLLPNAEVTTESNPESTSPQFFARIREAGYTRVSLGMQSASAHVLAVLERTHAGASGGCSPGGGRGRLRPCEPRRHLRHPGRVRRRSRRHARRGTRRTGRPRLGVRTHRRGWHRVRPQSAPRELAEPDDDVLAARYERIDERLSAAGLQWYEVSNWARGDDGACRHNEAYWRSDDWWGIGPGRTPTSPARVGGTASTPRGTPQSWPRGTGPARTGRADRTRPARRNRHVAAADAYGTVRGRTQRRRAQPSSAGCAVRAARRRRRIVRAHRPGRLLADGVVGTSSPADLSTGVSVTPDNCRNSCQMVSLR